MWGEGPNREALLPFENYCFNRTCVLQDVNFVHNDLDVFLFLNMSKV